MGSRLGLAGWAGPSRNSRAFPALALALAAACGDAGQEPAAPHLRAPPRRVVVLGPSTVETLYALGAGGALVGVCDYCRWPEAASLPRAGGQLNPNLERVAGLRPDCVLVQGQHPVLQSWCEQAGVDFHAFTTDSWGSWEQEVAYLARLFQVEERGAELLREARAALAAARVELTSPPRTLLVVSRRAGEIGGLVVAGGGSFLSELLEAAGGRNAFADNPRNYFDLNEEALVRAAPELILELDQGAAPAEIPALETWRRFFSDLPAVRDGRVHVLSADFLLLPGPRMPQTAALFGRYLKGES